jgi:arylsulfatase A-like enzyme
MLDVHMLDRAEAISHTAISRVPLGKYAFRTGMPFPLIRNTDIGLTNAHTSLASQLGNRGYSTHLVGKWHLGESPATCPLENGFDSFFGLLGGGFNHFTKRGQCLD